MRLGSRQLQYFVLKKTLFGTSVKSPLFRGVGPNPGFGPPWNPDECVLHVPVSSTHRQMIVIRVLDCKDNVVGECLVNALTVGNGRERRARLRRQDKMVAIDLFYNLVRAVPTENNSDAVVRLKVCSVRGLGSKVDGICIQAYELPDTREQFQLLPPPLSTEISISQFVLPFEITLPSDLPSSFASSHNNMCVTYSLSATIDTSTKITRSTLFYVQQPTAAVTMLTPLYKTLSCPINVAGFMSLICNSQSLGTLQTDMYLERTAYAPGEVMSLVCRVSSDWFEAGRRVFVSAQLIQCVQSSLERSRELEFPMSDVIPITSEATPIVVPSVPPTYLGNITQNVLWFDQVSESLGKWFSMPPEPFKWWYVLRVTVKLPKIPGLSVVPMKKIINLPVVICGVGLNVLPAAGGNIAHNWSCVFPSPPSAVSLTPSFTTEESSSIPEASSFEEPVAIVLGSEVIVDNEAAVGTLCVTTHGFDNVPETELIEVVPDTQVINSSYEFIRRRAVSNVDVDAIVFPDEQSSDTQKIPDWRQYPEIQGALRRLELCSSVMQTGRPVMIKDVEDLSNQPMPYLPRFYCSGS